MMEETTTAEQVANVAFTHAYAKLPVQDVERARAFYEEKLGLVPYGKRHGHLYYRAGSASFMLFPSSGEPSGTHDQLGLVVGDLGEVVILLRKRGVFFESYPPPPGATVKDGVMDAGFVKAAWFKDSEGNLLSVAEFPSGSPFE
jgi:catechol 2,3-dioxygenase-like lactoylglutathione lyase family enzyme